MYGYQLHKMRLDGTDTVRLDDYSLFNDFVFFSDGRIYFEVSSDDVTKVRSIDLDGADKFDLECGDLYYIIAVEDGWIYYQSESTMIEEGYISDWKEIQGNIYRIRTDGSDKQEIVF